MQKIIFRVDSGRHIGVGHLMRCLTLAEELSQQNCQIHIITKEHHGNFISLIPKSYILHIMKNNIGITSQVDLNNYQTWLGNNINEEIDETNIILKNIGYHDIFILDNYSLSRTYEENINSNRIMVIDDINRDHNCHLLLDQNITADIKKYKSLNKNDECLYLMGPKYSLIKAIFPMLRKQKENKVNQKSKPFKILISFGGTDVKNDTIKVLKALDELREMNFSASVIIDAQNPFYSEIKKIEKKNLEKINIMEFTNDFPSLMSEANIFLGAGGSTSWERCCLGLPGVVVASSKNQEEICEHLEQRKLVIYLGRSESNTVEDWRNMLKDISEKKIDIEIISKNTMMVTDGYGCRYVVEKILEK